MPPKLLVAVNSGGAVASTPFGGPAITVHPGDWLVIYALGLGPTSPTVETGAASPSNPLAVVRGANSVDFGNGAIFHAAKKSDPLFMGLTPTYVGLYQINVQIPADSPPGASVPVYLDGDIGTSNTLLFNIQ